MVPNQPSSASKDVFSTNTLASFQNFFNDKIQLSGDWGVAVSEIIFLTKTEIIVNGNLIKSDLKNYEHTQKMSAGANAFSRPNRGQKLPFVPGTFDTVAQLLAKNKRTVELPHLSFREMRSSEKNDIFLGKYEKITVPREEIPSIIGLKGIPDGNRSHIRYKLKPNTNRFTKSDEKKAYYGEFPADVCAGKHIIFIYTNIIEYQYVGNTKAGVLRVIDLRQHLKNSSVCVLEPTYRIVFANLDYNKLLTNTIQSNLI